RRRPPIHVIIGVGNFGWAKPIPACDVEQRVALANGVGLQRTDQVVAAGGKWIADQRSVLEIVFAPAVGKPRRREQRDRRQHERCRGCGADPRIEPRSLVMHCYARRLRRAPPPSNDESLKNDRATSITRQPASSWRISAPAASPRCAQSGPTPWRRRRAPRVGAR